MRAPEGRALVYTGLAGVVLSAVCVVAMLFHGDAVGAEGHLSKAAAFNVALGPCCSRWP